MFDKLIRKNFSIGAGSCGYTEPNAKSAGALFFANNGLSLSSIALNTVVLGQNVGQVGSPGRLLSAREIPLNAFSLTFTQVGGVATAQLVLKSDPAKVFAVPQILFQNSAGVETGRILMDGAGNNNSLVIGASAGLVIAATGIRNVIVGMQAGAALTSGNRNVIIGFQAGNTMTTGSNNTIVGLDACSVGVLTGNTNAIFGDFGGQQLTSGSSNTYIGSSAGSRNTTGSNNTMIGFGAGGETVSGTNNPIQNTYIGAGCGQQQQWGNNNFLAGFKCGFASTGGATNVIISPAGLQAGEGIGSNNVVLGASMVVTIATSIGSSNVLIGGSIAGTGVAGSFGANCIMIGANITSPTLSLTNSTVIGQGIACSINNIANIGRADQNVMIGNSIVPADNGARLQVNGQIITDQGTMTNAPGKWRLGKIVVAASVLNAARYLETEIDGVAIKICVN